MDNEHTYTAFAGHKQVGAGSLREVLTRLKQQLDQGNDETVLVFEDETGRQVDFDLRGTLDEVLEREAPLPARGPGRPKLGVASREVSLLPRHWEWLEQQPNGISAALRRLVEQARKAEPGREKARRIRAALSRFMWGVAGDLPDYEEASRALFAGDQARLIALTKKWPKDVRTHVTHVAQSACDADIDQTPPA